MSKKKKETVKPQTYNVWSLDDIPGIGPTNQKRLREAGIHTYHGMMVAGPIEVNDETQIGIDKANTAVEHCRKILVGLGKIRSAQKSGYDVLMSREKLGHIDTGNHSLNDALGGGFEMESLIEAYGEFGSGKTQLAHTLAVMAQKPVAEGGLDGKVIWIDTENTFRPNRIVEIGKGRGLIKTEPDIKKVLDAIEVTRVYSTDEMRMTVEHLDRIIAENREKKGKKIRLVIIDSIIALPRAEYQGQGKLARKYQHVNHMLLMLKRQAEMYDLVVYYSNQVYDDINAWGDSTRPSGGHAVAHASTYRLYLKKGKVDKDGRQGVLKIIDSPEHSNYELLYNLSKDEGFGDLKKDKD